MSSPNFVYRFLRKKLPETNVYWVSMKHVLRYWLQTEFSLSFMYLCDNNLKITITYGHKKQLCLQTISTAYV